MEDTLFDGYIKVGGSISYSRRYFTITREWITRCLSKPKSGQTTVDICVAEALFIQDKDDIYVLADGRERIYLKDDRQDNKNKNEPSSWVDVLQKICTKGTWEDVLHLERFGKPVARLWFPTMTSPNKLHETQQQDKATVLELAFGTTMALASTCGGQIAIIGVALQLLVDHFYDSIGELELQIKQLDNKIQMIRVNDWMSQIYAELKAIQSTFENLMCIDFTDNEKIMHIITIWPNLVKIHEYFKNENGAFYTNPMASAPYVVKFANFCVAYAQLVEQLFPKYIKCIMSLLEEMKLYISKYQDGCVKERLSAISDTEGSWGCYFAASGKAAYYSTTSPLKMTTNTLDRKYMDKKVIDKMYPIKNGTETREFYANVKELNAKQLVATYGEEISRAYSDYFRITFEIIQSFIDKDRSNCNKNDEIDNAVRCKSPGDKFVDVIAELMKSIKLQNNQQNTIDVNKE